MSFAENLQYLRKQKNITQEQLAEQLEVSRQSVSKWESAQSYPEMEKLLQICSMFHCSMDTLMQGDVSKDFVEDVHGYDKFISQFNKVITAGIALILLGISAMSLAVGKGMKEEYAAAFFFVFLIVGVMLLVVMGMQHAHFQEKHPYIEDFYTEEEREQEYRKFTIRIAAGIGVILVGMLFFMVAESRLENMPLDAEWIEKGEMICTSVFMLFITVGVSALVYGGLQKGKYNIEEYNREVNPSPEKKKRDALKRKVYACIMLAAVIIYLVWSFMLDSWSKAWLVFAVGGILCGVASVILSKDEDAQQ
ncbi:MAG: helix-turn-helix domain-containing protein [Clostridium sp.]|nr:helix-turn-helix domain-containing protein [Clostridium sp.]